MVGKHRSAFTIVELLVTFSILLILSAVLLPAVQSSREAARLANCRNNISQLSKGMIEFETFNGYFPSGGWSSQWLGVAERSSDSSQPGGWTYGVLPFIEEMGTRNLVAGVNSSNLATQYAKLATASVPTFSCPSRRGSQSLPVASATPFQTAAGSIVLSKATRSDFAVNSGAIGSCPGMEVFEVAIATAAKGSKKSNKVTICHAPPGNPTNTQTLTVAESALNGPHAP